MTVDGQFRYVADAISVVTTALHPPLDLDETLRVITRSAADTVPGVAEASISVTGRDGRIRTLAPTDSRVSQADRLQYELRQGPCLDAVIQDPIVVIGALAADPRWPDFGPKAAALGFASQVAFQFRAAPDIRGALNLYGVRPHAIDPEAVRLGSVFAGHVSVAMGWARHETNLNEALATRNRIGQAVGIVMERYGLDSDRAFAFLVRVSQSTNEKLRLLADRIVDTANQQARD